jgi:putative FmdB family regulatory protein
MPTYGYKCEKCQHSFEIFQNINDRPVTTCPECGGKTNRIFYPVGIIFKGSGFHITDYCRPKETQNKPKQNTEEAPKKEKETTKTEKDQNPSSKEKAS